MSYPFLSQPPPPRRRSPTYSYIQTWANLVQPGSPAPITPRHVSLTSTPLTADFKPDLTALGYTAVFVHIPPTPPPVPRNMPNANLKKSRSMASLRSKPAAPRTPTSARKPPSSPRTAARKKRTLYPAPLAADLALLQFTSGGTEESHARTLMAAQARAAAGSHKADANALGTVHRARDGTLWWDADEELEYAPLVGAETPSEWTHFTPESHSHSILSSRRSSEVLVRPASSTHLPLVPEPGQGQAGGNLKPGCILALPARRKKPAHILTLSALPFPLPPSPLSSRTPRTPSWARSARKVSGEAKEQARVAKGRRPAPPPLTLPPRSPSPKTCVTSPSPRAAFLGDSFAPPPLPVPPMHAMTLPAHLHSTARVEEKKEKKTGMARIGALFRSRR